MDSINQKFNNLKAFLKSKVKQDNDFLTLFYNTPIEFFIITIKKKKADKITKEQCIDEIFTTAKLNIADYAKEDMDKLDKYFEYFMEVVDYIVI